jgi:hypothetical protein
MSTDFSWGKIREDSTNFLIDGRKIGICHTCGNNKNTFIYEKDGRYIVGCCLCDIKTELCDTVVEALCDWVEIQPEKRSLTSRHPSVAKY